MKENRGGCVERFMMKRTKEVVARGGGQHRRWLEKDGDGGGDVQPVTPPKPQQRNGIPLGVLLHSSNTQVTEKDLKRDVKKCHIRFK
uniref:Uncharacterized protein n=1 Tax=Tanacetum cinerariifolium TaxID=118510 RepID=A0A699JLA8_TANCI|nr:hypothetical protein [Tanacetum cinerariifolium]